MRRCVGWREGIGTRPFFWPMHEQPVYRSMGMFEGRIASERRKNRAPRILSAERACA